MSVSAAKNCEGLGALLAEFWCESGFQSMVEEVAIQKCKNTILFTKLKYIIISMCGNMNEAIHHNVLLFIKHALMESLFYKCMIFYKLLLHIISNIFICQID